MNGNERCEMCFYFDAIDDLFGECLLQSRHSDARTVDIEDYCVQYIRKSEKQKPQDNYYHGYY